MTRVKTTSIGASIAFACLTAAGAALAADPAAIFADPTGLPAVAAPNGKLSFEGGASGANGVRTRETGFVSGSYTIPLSHQFGYQIDAAGGSVSNRFSGGVGSHFFYRNPSTFLFGLTAGGASLAGAQTGRFGAEAEIYAGGAVTFSGAAGYQTKASSAFAVVQEGAYGNVAATFYPDPNFAITAGLSRSPNVWGGYTRIEYQPEAWKNASVFANAQLAERGQFAVTAGAQFYFGAQKTLIRRHREDDPPNMLSNPASLITGAALASIQRKWLTEVKGSSISSNGVCPAGKFYEPIIKMCI